jgi:hypothetical protein
MTPPFNPDKPPLESAKRSIEVDMSPAAIDRRMREMSALWEFWRFLRKFRPVGAPTKGVSKGPFELGGQKRVI